MTSRLISLVRRARLACGPFGLVVGLAVCSTIAAASVEQAKLPVSLEGKLVSFAGGEPGLQTARKRFALSGKTSYLQHTLEDKRLLGREVRLEGSAKSDGSFVVERLYTVREGKVYRVRYFCEVCNIEALEPGNCVCCQQPTELQEIPVSGSLK